MPKNDSDGYFYADFWSAGGWSRIMEHRYGVDRIVVDFLKNAVQATKIAMQMNLKA